jgi:hypothetical protein
MTSLSYVVSFTGFDLVETFLTQPLVVIAGSEAGSLWHSQELYAKALGPKELVMIDCATQLDLYDGPRLKRSPPPHCRRSSQRTSATDWTPGSRPARALRRAEGRSDMAARHCRRERTSEGRLNPFQPPCTELHKHSCSARDRLSKSGPLWRRCPAARPPVWSWQTLELPLRCRAWPSFGRSSQPATKNKP